MDTKERKSGSTHAGGKGRAATAPGKRTAAKRSTPAQKERTGSRPRRPADSEIVYTQPKPFNRRQLLLQLATVAAVVLALLFGMSIFFKVDEDKILISGAEKYTAMQVREAAGIRNGENLLLVSDAKVSARILSALPYVQSVRVGIQLPDTVQIEIVELQVVYAIEADDGSWWLMSAAGEVVERTNAATAATYTKIQGVQLTQPQVGEKAKAAEQQTEPTDTAGETVPVTISGKDRLDAVITILEYMEDSGIIGNAASLDVSDMGAIEFWYGKQYQVKLGNSTQLGYKVQTAALAIRQLLEKTDNIIPACWMPAILYGRMRSIFRRLRNFFKKSLPKNKNFY